MEFSEKKVQKYGNSKSTFNGVIFNKLRPYFFRPDF